MAETEQNLNEIIYGESSCLTEAYSYLEKLEAVKDEQRFIGALLDEVDTDSKHGDQKHQQLKKDLYQLDKKREQLQEQAEQHIVFASRDANNPKIKPEYTLSDLVPLYCRYLLEVNSRLSSPDLSHEYLVQQERTDIFQLSLLSLFSVDVPLVTDAFVDPIGGVVFSTPQLKICHRSFAPYQANNSNLDLRGSLEITRTDNVETFRFGRNEIEQMVIGSEPVGNLISEAHQDETYNHAEMHRRFGVLALSYQPQGDGKDYLTGVIDFGSFSF